MPPRRLTILGVGLLGGSIGLAVRSRINYCRVVGYGHRAATLQVAKALGAIDETYDEPGHAVRGSDWVILCTPVSMLAPLLEQIAPDLSDGAIVTDVGSTKRHFVEAAERLLPVGVHCVGSHPMAGSEKRGVQFARADLFEGAVCITTPTPKTNAAALQAVESFWQMLGMRTTRLTPEMHDRLLAEVSHLPHVVAAALVALQEDPALDLCGKGFLDMTRIAGGDAGLWRDILLDNRDNIRKSIQRLQANLEKMSALLDGNDAEAVKGWLEAAALRRLKLLNNSSPE